MAGLLDNLFGMQYSNTPGSINLGQYPADTAAPSTSASSVPGTASPSATVMAAAPPGISSVPSDPTANAAAPTDSATSSTDPITIQGDPWHPVHRNVLGRIADALAGKPIYEQRMRDRDMQDAMSVWDPENPQATIRRIAQIPGMAGTAINMAEKFGDEKDKEDARAIRNSAKEMVIGDRLGAMAGAATPQNWGAMRQQMVNMLNVWGKKPEDYDIPQNFDQNWADSMSKGAISAANQARLAQQKQMDLQRYSLQTQRLSLQRQEEADRNNHFDINQQNRTTKNAKPFSYADPDFVQKAGGPAIISGDRMHMVVTKPDGTEWGFQNAGDSNGRTNWIPLGETPASIKRRQALAAQQGQ